MAVQILDRPGFGAQLGQSLSTGITGGISEGLDAYTKHLIRNKQAEGLSKLLNIPLEQAKSYTYLDPSITREAVKQGRLSQQETDFQKALEFLDQPKDQRIEPLVQDQAFNQKTVVQPQFQEKSSVPEKLPSTFEAINLLKESQLQKLLKNTGAPNQSLALPFMEAAKTSEATSSQVPNVNAIKDDRKELDTYKSQTEKLSDYIRQKGLKIKPEQRLKIEELINEREKIANDREKNVRTLNKDGIEQLKNDASIARDRMKIYDDIIEIASNPEWLRDPALYRLGATLQLKGSFASLGLEELSHIWESPSQELLNKLTAELAQGSASIYGGNLTNREFETYQQAIVSAKNSPEGIIALSKIGKLREQAKDLKYRKYRELSKRYGRNLPYDILEEVQDEVEPQLNRIKNEEMKIIKDTIAKQEKKSTKQKAWFQKENPLLSL